MQPRARPEAIFVGRQRELSELTAALEDAIKGSGRLVMLAGEPGIGKTRTAQELAALAGELGAQVYWGWCYEEEGAPPYWPWVQPLRTCLQEKSPQELADLLGTGAADIAEIVPEVQTRLPALKPTPTADPEQARFRLFDSITTFWKNLSQAKPTVVVLEDLHNADRSSLLLLEFLARQMADSRLVVIATYRDVEVSRRHPLSLTLGTLIREQLLLRVQLGGFGKADVGQFVHSHSGVALSNDLLESVHDRTDGNPLFLGELIRLLGQANVPASELWTQALPEGVRDVIGRRLDRLSEYCNQVLTAASVIGREFDLQLLGILTRDLDEDRLLEVLEEARAARVIEELPHAVDRYQFTHALIQETLREEVSLARRVRLHARIGEVLEGIYANDLEAHASELAYHFALAEPVTGPDKLVRYSLVAGERALAAYAYEEALAHFQRGLVSRGIALTGAQPAPDEEAAVLLFGLGRAQFPTVERHRIPDAVACLRRALDYYAEAGEVDHAVAIAEYPFPLVTGRLLGGAAQLVHRALELVQPDSHDEGRLLSQYSRAGYFEENDYDAARNAYTRALAIAERENDKELELRTLGNAGQVELFHGNYQKSLEMNLRGVELARRVENAPAELNVQTLVVINRVITCDLLGAKPHLESLRDLAQRLLDRNSSAASFLNSVVVSAYEGEWEAARHFSDQGLAALSMDIRCLATRVQLEYELGEFDLSDAYLKRLLDAMRLIPPGPTHENMLTALVIPLAARVNGNTRHFEFAEAAAEVIRSTAGSPTIIVRGARAGQGFMAVHREDPVAAADYYASLTSSRGTAVAGGVSLVFDRILGLLAQTMGKEALIPS